MKSFLLRRNIYLLVTIIVILLGTIGVLVFEGSGRDIASSVIASGLVSMFYLYSKYVDDVDRDRRIAFDAAGLYRVNPTRRADYATPLKAAATQVDVMGYSLRSFLDDHAATLRMKGGNGFQARILVVAPDSPASRAQESAEGFKAGTFATAIEHIRDAFADNDPMIQVRTTNHALPTMVFRMDDAMFVGPYFSHESSAVTATMELRGSGWLFAEYEAEFEALWKAGVALT
jgi:hypothetical protein